MEYFFYIMLFILVPILYFSIFRKIVFATAITAITGSVILCSRMLYLELNADDGDVDGIFIISMLIWVCGLVLLYILYAIVFAIIKHLWIKCKKEAK
jgi:hypothetical protein